MITESHTWTGRPGALCSCGWAETSNIHGMHEDWRRHVAEAMEQPSLFDGGAA